MVVVGRELTLGRGYPSPRGPRSAREPDANGKLDLDDRAVFDISTGATADLERSVGLFDTRLVLRVPDAAASVRLLVEARAEDLDGIGEAWPLLAGRIRGFHMPPEHVEPLVAEMRRRMAMPDASDPVDGVEPAAPPAEYRSLEGAGPAVTGEMEGHAEDAVEDDATAEPGRQLRLIRAVVLGPREGGPRLHVQVLGAHATRLEGGDVIRPEGTSLGWQLFELTASYPPGDVTVSLVGRLVWPELDLTQEQVARRIYNHLHDLQAA